MICLVWINLVIDLAIAQNDNSLTISGFGRPFGIGKDLKGGLLVTDMDLHALFWIKGDFSQYYWLRSEQHWQGPFEFSTGHNKSPSRLAPKLFHGPHSVAYNRNHELIVTCYYTPKIVILNEVGLSIKTLKKFNGGIEMIGPATGMLCEYTGALLVTDYASGTVFQVLKSNETEIYEGKIISDQICDRPHMTISLAKNIFLIADTWNDRLLYLDQEGRKFLPFTKMINKPVAIDIIEGSRILVTCWGSNQLSVLDMDNNDVKNISIHGLNKPYDARILNENLVIANSHAGTVEIYPQELSL